MDLQIIADKLNEMGVERVQIKGSDVMCCCPFHPDRSPSFGVHPDNGANCFACGARFSTADKMFQALADKTGQKYTPIYRDIPENYDYLPEIVEEPRPLNKKVLRFYKDDPEYFIEKWGVSREVIDRRQLKIDPFTSNECYPIIDSNGDYWGCVERTPPVGKLRSRYHYPPGYPRKKILIGEDRVEGQVWVVEGVRDLCSVETKTGESAVALGGAKISRFQLDKLKRYDSIVLCLDNDRAGRECRDDIIQKMPFDRVLMARYNGKDPVEATDFDIIKSVFRGLIFEG